MGFRGQAVLLVAFGRRASRQRYSVRATPVHAILVRAGDGTDGIDVARKVPGREAFSRPGVSLNPLSDDDLYAPVLRLAHTHAGRNQQMRFAEALRAD
jgi:hypothetical protein